MKRKERRKKKEEYVFVMKSNILIFLEIISLSLINPRATGNLHDR
jgi:hypothetical protein